MCQALNGEETKDGAATATADSAAAAAQRHVDSAVFGYSATAAHHIAPGAEYEATQLSEALGESALSYALEASARQVSVVGTEGEGEGGPSALPTPAEGDYVLVGSEDLTGLRPGTLPLPPPLTRSPPPPPSAPLPVKPPPPRPQLLYLPIDHLPQP